MRCGEKCFYVKLDKNNETVQIPVNARTTAGARKTIRNEFGKDVEIISVQTKR
jgi:RNA polymerase-interacting CarD/CdnL/TRCF family regulator